MGTDKTKTVSDTAKISTDNSKIMPAKKKTNTKNYPKPMSQVQMPGSTINRKKLDNAISMNTFLISCCTKNAVANQNFMYLCS